MGLCYDLKGIPNNIIYVLLDDARRNMWKKHICLCAFGSLISNHSHFVFFFFPKRILYQTYDMCMIRYVKIIYIYT